MAGGDGRLENEAVIDLFAAFSRRVVEALGNHCKLWVTINEPNVYMSGGYLGGGFPPGKNDLKAGLKVLSNLLKAHAAAYQAIHEAQSDSQVGVAHHWRGFLPENSNPSPATAQICSIRYLMSLFPRLLLRASSMLLS